MILLFTDFLYYNKIMHCICCFEWNGLFPVVIGVDYEMEINLEGEVIILL